VALAVRRAFRGLRDDEGMVFQWCWLLTSLVFLSIAQSKLPSYAFYLFVPLAVLIGRTLDDVLTRGFASDGERKLVIGFAAVQCLLVLGLPFVKAARSFTFPVSLVAVCLAVSLIFLLRKQLAPWLLTSASASLALLVGALTVALPAVEAESSARPVAAALLKERQPDEPLLSGKFLVRGLIYYTRLPVSVLANKPQPFWAEHPLPVIVGRKGLRAFADQHPTVLCALRKSDWAWLDDEEVFAGREAFAALGENIIVRARDPVPGEPAKKPAPAVTKD
jgi:4-amino-4-deoxy-L-arabinose transferase-like glycosyltransferase